MSAARIVPALPPRILLPLIVAVALFMENLDSTALGTALPAIAVEFGESPIRLKLALTSYLLSLAVFIPASGWLADRYGARNIFRLAIALFTTGSILCGLSATIGELVGARVLQGLGGALMMPVGRLVLLRSIPKSELVSALAWLTIPALIGPMVGPLVGGIFTTWFDWRWVFWINAPIGVLGIVLATVFFPDIRGEERVRFDTPGFLLSAIGLAAFVSASTSFGLGVLPRPLVIALFAGGLAFLAGYFVYSRRVANPILDLGLFGLPTFRASVVGGFLFRLGVGASPFLMPLFLQLGFGLTPFESGAITVAGAFGAILMKVVAVPILRRFGFRNILVVNALVASVFIALPAAFTPLTPVAVIVLVLLVGGFFRSLEFTSINAIAYADVPLDRMSSATSLASVVHQLALSMGITLGAFVLDIRVAADGIIDAGDFPPAFLAVAALSATSVIVFWLLPRDAGEEMSGHQRPRLANPAPELGDRT